MVLVVVACPMSTRWFHLVAGGCSIGGNNPIRCRNGCTIVQSSFSSSNLANLAAACFERWVMSVLRVYTLVAWCIYACVYQNPWILSHSGARQNKTNRGFLHDYRCTSTIVHSPMNCWLKLTPPPSTPVHTLVPSWTLVYPLVDTWINHRWIGLFLVDFVSVFLSVCLMATWLFRAPIAICLAFQR